MDVSITIYILHVNVYVVCVYSLVYCPSKINILILREKGLLVICLWVEEPLEIVFDDPY